MFTTKPKVCLQVMSMPNALAQRAVQEDDVRKQLRLLDIAERENRDLQEVLSDLEFVRSCWRGDGVLGIKRSRYILEPGHAGH